MTPSPGFVYVANLAEWTPPPGEVIAISRHIRSKRDLFGRLHKRLQLPGYFGNNWDALNDCLHDLSWLPGVTHVSLLHDGLPFGSSSQKLRTIYLQLLSGLTAPCEHGSPQWTIVFPEACRAEIEYLLTRS